MVENQSGWDHLWYGLCNSSTLDIEAAILADDIFKWVFLNENGRIRIQISLKFVPKSPIDNKPALVLTSIYVHLPTYTKFLWTLQLQINTTANNPSHYSDVIMGEMASQITSLTIVYLTVYWDADQRKHQGSSSLAFVRGIHQWPVNSPHNRPVTRKMFPFDDVIMRDQVPWCRHRHDINSCNDNAARYSYCCLTFN